MRAFLSSLSVVAVMAAAMMANAEEETASSFYNPGESQGSFDWIMKPYPIPARTTTYTDFFFNIPDDLPDLFHIVATLLGSLEGTQVKMFEQSSSQVT